MSWVSTKKVIIWNIFGTKSILWMFLDLNILFSLCLNWLCPIGHIFSYVPLPKNSSFHDNQISGIYEEFSRTKRSIDIPNGYIY